MNYFGSKRRILIMQLNLFKSQKASTMELDEREKSVYINSFVTLFIVNLWIFVVLIVATFIQSINSKTMNINALYVTTILSVPGIVLPFLLIKSKARIVKLVYIGAISGILCFISSIFLLFFT